MDAATAILAAVAVITAGVILCSLIGRMCSHKWKVDDDHHRKVCEKCGDTRCLHKWEAARELSFGVMEYECAYCGESEMREP